MSLIYNATFDKNTRKLSFEDKAGNEIYSFTVPERAPTVDDITKPLTFRATQDGSTVKLRKNGSPTGSFQTSMDGGNTWVNYTLNTAIALNIGDEVSFRAKSDRSSQTSSGYFQFEMTGKIEAWHNVMSMIIHSGFATYNTVFERSLERMFKGCTSLIKAPKLPATTLAPYCYDCMFEGCTSLTEAPDLPATTLATGCYAVMFGGCTSLIKAPALPATTLPESCYIRMFEGCTSLIKAPELTATKLYTFCCKYMFNGCSSLNEVRFNIPSSYSFSDISSYTSYWLNGVASTGTFYTYTSAKWTSGASGIPEGWTRVNERDPSLDDITRPLTFKSTQDGSTVTLNKYGSPSGAFETSRDGGNTWSDYTIEDAIALNIGEEVSFRAKSDRTSAQSDLNYFQFMMEGKIEAWHNVMSLYRTNDFATYNTAMSYSFHNLFKGCTSLTRAPALPATSLADSCYMDMFNGCTSLTEAPELKSTSLADHCYSYMFNGCTSLTEAPALPATTLVTSCYIGMFNGCTSLAEAPVLQATTLADSCYMDMFKGCSSLNEVRCKIPSSYSSSDISSYASNWLSGVSSTGTFLTNEDVNWPSGASGIPEGWTRFNEGSSAVDDITKPLTFRAARDGSTVKLTNRRSPSGAFQTSRDGGNTWTDYRIGTAITLNTGDKVSFRAKSDRTSDQDANNHFQFEMTGKIEAWHNVMSLYRTNDFATYDTVVKFAFNYLFSGCKSLIKAPVLPATTLASDCYSTMFNSTSLTEAPALPATTLPYACYYGMFSGCSSLTKAPELTANTLTNLCCHGMFGGCSSLNEVRCKIPSSYSSSQISSYTSGWLSNVASTGTFYTNEDANWPSGASGIPTGWTRVNA